MKLPMEIISLIILQTRIITCQLEGKGLERLWLGLGWRQIEFQVFHRVECVELMNLASQVGIRSQCSDILTQSSIPIVLAENQESLFKFIQDWKGPPNQLMYLTKSDRLDILRNTLKDMKVSRSFFIALENQAGDFELLNAFTFRQSDQVSLTPWKLVTNHGVHYFKESYNLQGVVLKAATLPWGPFVQVHECEGIGQHNCNVSGSVPSALSHFGELFNFSVTFDMPSKTWGSLIEVVKLDNGTEMFQLEGNLRDIALGDYDLSGATWDLRLHFSKLVSQTHPIFFHNYRVYVKRDVKTLDGLLLLRPFSTESWMALGSSVIIYFLLKLCLKSFCNTFDYRLLDLPFWILFLLVHSYYSGALTMFFSAAPTLPFQNWRSAIEKFPEWKPLTLAGMEDILRLASLESESEVSGKLIEDMRTMNLFKPNIEDVFSSLQETRNTYFILDELFLLNEMSKRTFTMPIIPLDTARTSQSGLLLKKNSPFSRMLTYGIVQMRQTGIKEHFDARTVSHFVFKENQALAEALALPQLLLGFAFYSLAMIAAILAVTAEIVIHKMGL